MDSLSLSVLTPHHASTGCHCKECWGLAEFMLETTGKDYGLLRSAGPSQPQKRPLKAVEPCTGAMTCECPKCTAERLKRMEKPRPRVRQPWQPKAA